MSSTQPVFRVERRNPADPCSSVWEGFAAVDTFDAATASIRRHHGIDGEAAADPVDRRRMGNPGEKWGFVREGIHWRITNATKRLGDNS